MAEINEAPTGAFTSKCPYPTLSANQRSAEFIPHAHELTVEQIAVVFAITSGLREPFHEIAAAVSHESTLGLRK